jgi:hypothetical protein
MKILVRVAGVCVAFLIVIGLVAWATFRVTETPQEKLIRQRQDAAYEKLYGKNGTAAIAAAQNPGSNLRQPEHGETEMDRLMKTIHFERTIKDNLRDPDSYERVDSMLGKDGSVCVEFRSKNGFGGMNVAYALLKQPANTYSLSESSDPTRFRKDWLKHCK